MSESSAAEKSQNPSLPLGFPGESSAPDGPNCASPSPNSDPVSKLIRDVIARRARGELVATDQLIASHPEMMPALRDELLALDAIHQAVVLSQKRDAEPYIEPAPHQGLRIDGYCIEREISSGGQATVFKAIQQTTGRIVAIKLMHGGPFMGSRGRKRFERESKIMAGLNHPNVVSILDKGRTTDGSFYLVMDFIEGSNLDIFARQLGKVTSTIVRLFVKVASAVDEAHRLGIVHRDLKPMNVLVDSRGEPHILDFGMARILNDVGSVGAIAIEHASLTHTGQVLGSLPWTSPEQVSGAPDAVDARSDVYALGIMLFVILAGEFPYPVKDGPRLISHHVANTPPASLTRLGQRNGMMVTRSLEEIVFKALSKSPSQRYASAGLLARDLEAWLAGKPRSLTRSRLATSRCFLISALSVILCIVFTFALYWFKDSPADMSIPRFTNAEGMLFVRISPGAVLLNSPKDPHGVNLIETSASCVDRPFYMSATVVTQKQFLRVTGQTSVDPNLKELNIPIQCVKWTDAVAFCDALSRRDKRKYRLPTQAEWRYALYRGMSGILKQDEINNVAWYAENSGLRLHAVAQKNADHCGLYDMIGDVRQWCSPSISSTTAPVDRKDEPPYLAEGADFLTPVADCLPPSTMETKYEAGISLPTIGFRVVCESP
jgi:serine/threonine protein kinase